MNELTKAKNKELRKQRKIQAIEKFNGICLKCGCDLRHNIGMATFHHIDNINWQKKENLAHLWLNSEEVRETELSKCMLLCKECHTQLHKVKGKKVDYVDSWDYIFSDL